MRTPAGHRARLERVYAEHPLTADAVLARVQAERGTLDGVSVQELAEAADGGPTDQNHAGGAAAVRALAAAVGLLPGWAVLDIGAGLGGAVRLLASEFGCRCRGVELTANRYRDAQRLTALVGLQDRVSFSHGDFMTTAVEDGPFDLAIGQGSFMHFPDTGALLARVAASLRAEGRLVIEEGTLLAPPAAAVDRSALDRLTECWNGRFMSLADWRRHLDAAGFTLQAAADLTPVAVTDFESSVHAADAGRLRASDDERAGWELGLRLLRGGVLGVSRLIAVRNR